MYILISFPGQADLNVVKKQLDEVFKIEDSKLYSEEFTYVNLFLPRKIVEAKGLDTELVDFLDKAFEGRQVEQPLDKYDDFETCMKKLDAEREYWYGNIVPDYVDKYSDHAYVLGTNLAAGVAKEIELVTRGAIKIML